MKFWLAIILSLVLALATNGHAATNVALSVNWTDVSNALYLCANGDTVVLPKGTSTWSGPLFSSKLVNWVGSGMDTTVITNTQDSGGQNAKWLLDIQWGGGAGYPFRITGIGFEGVQHVGTNAIYLVTNVVENNHSGGGVQVSCNAATDVDSIRGFRIDHCRFRNLNCWLCQNHYVQGLIDHCEIIDNGNGLQELNDNNSVGWARGDVVGTTNCLMVESCLIALSTNYYSKSHGQQHDSGQGSHTVWRFNVISNASPWEAFWQAHGNNSLIDEEGEQRGAQFGEIYGNKIYGPFLFVFRGGQVMCYSNEWFNGQESKLKFTDEEAWYHFTGHPSGLYMNYCVGPRGHFWATNFSQDGITNSFIWANTVDGVPTTIYPYIDPGSGDYVGNVSNVIRLGRDYWLEKPSATNGLPLGAMASYQPLVYPHPIVSTNGGGAVGELIIPPVAIPPGKIQHIRATQVKFK